MNTKKQFSNAWTKAREVWTRRKKPRLEDAVTSTVVPEVTKDISETRQPTTESNQVCSLASYVQVKAESVRRQD